MHLESFNELCSQKSVCYYMLHLQENDVTISYDNMHFLANTHI